jgi:hypothetical protein
MHYYSDDLAVHANMNNMCETVRFAGRNSVFHRSNRFCFGGRDLFTHYIDYIHAFFDGYADAGVGRFLLWNSMQAHEESGTRLRLLDAPLEQALRRLMRRHARRTAVILMADHGLGFGEWSSTHFSHAEYRYVLQTSNQFRRHANNQIIK